MLRWPPRVPRSGCRHGGIHADLRLATAHGSGHCSLAHSQAAHTPALTQTVHQLAVGNPLLPCNARSAPGTTLEDTAGGNCHNQAQRFHGIFQRMRDGAAHDLRELCHPMLYHIPDGPPSSHSLRHTTFDIWKCSCRHSSSSSLADLKSMLLPLMTPRSLHRTHSDYPAAAR